MNVSSLLRGCAIISLWAISQIGFAAQQIGPREIVKIFTYPHFVVVHYSPSSTNAALECPDSSLSSRYVAIRSDDNKLLLASLYTAIATNKALAGIGVAGCFASWGGIPVAYRVDLAQ